MGINKNGFLKTIKSRLSITGAAKAAFGGIAKDEIKSMSSMYKARSNVRKLAARYKIDPGVYGNKNYDKVIKTAYKMLDKGNMIGIRNYFKSQQEKAKKQKKEEGWETID